MITIFKSRTGDQVMVDSNAEMAFGPVFGEDENPQVFIEWALGLGYPDLRTASPDALSDLVDAWRKQAKEVVV